MFMHKSHIFLAETSKYIQFLFLIDLLVPVDQFEMHFDFESSQKFPTRAKIWAEFACAITKNDQILRVQFLKSGRNPMIVQYFMEQHPIKLNFNERAFSCGHFDMLYA